MNCCNPRSICCNPSATHQLLDALVTFEVIIKGTEYYDGQLKRYVTRLIGPCWVGQGKTRFTRSYWTRSPTLPLKDLQVSTPDRCSPFRCSILQRNLTILWLPLFHPSKRFKKCSTTHGFLALLVGSYHQQKISQN